MNSLISIIVPVYNNLKYFDKCINSIIEQTYKELQIIIVDDGSERNIKEKLNVWEKIDKRLEVHNIVHSGVAAARNFGMSVANGDFIAFVDSDDFIEPHMIAKLKNIIECYNADFSVCNYTIFKNECNINFLNLKLVSEITIYESLEAQEELFTGNKIQGFLWNKLFRKEVLAGMLLNEKMQIYEDIYFLSKILKKNNYLIAYTNEKLYYYRNYSDSTTHSIEKLVNENGEWIHIGVLEDIKSMYEGVKSINRCINLTIIRTCVQGRVLLAGRKEYKRTYKKLKYCFKEYKKIICFRDINLNERVIMNIKICTPNIYRLIKKIFLIFKG